MTQKGARYLESRLSLQASIAVLLEIEKKNNEENIHHHEVMDKARTVA